MKCYTKFLSLIVVIVFVIHFVVYAQTLDEDLNKASKLFESKKYEEAAKAYNEIIVKYQNVLKENLPRAVEVWEAFAKALKAAGKTQASEEAFKRADKIKQKLSSKKENRMNIEPSKEIVDKYNLKSLKNAEAQNHYRRGAAYLEEKHILYAILEFEKALKLEPENLELIDIAARTMAEYGEGYFDEAKNLLQKLRKSLGDTNMSKEQWVMLGRAATFAKKYDFKLAEECLNNALKLDPKFFLAILFSGDLELTRGNYKKALEWYEKALKMEPDNLKALWGAGDANTGLKEYQKALDFYAQAFELKRDSSEAAYKYAIGLKNLNRVDEAIHFLEYAIKLDPTKAKYHLGLVEIYLPRVMDFSAYEHLQAALGLEPENPLCHYYNGVYLEMRRRIDEAIVEYQKAAYFNPEMLDAKYHLANIYNATGNTFPGNNFSNTNPADLIEYLPYKDLKRAYNLYKEILSINPNYKHANEIRVQLEKLEEIYSKELELKKEVNKATK